MNANDKFDGNHFITAQVIIPADSFAKEMLGENPTPQKLEDFIRDNASLAHVVYGTACIAHQNQIPLDILEMFSAIKECMTTLTKDTDFLMRHVTEVEMQLMLKKEPWCKRIFRI